MLITSRAGRSVPPLGGRVSGGLTGLLAVVRHDTHVRHPLLKLSHPVGDCPLRELKCEDKAIAHEFGTTTSRGYIFSLSEPKYPSTEAIWILHVSQTCPARWVSSCPHARLAKAHIVREDTTPPLKMLRQQPLEPLQLDTSTWCTCTLARKPGTNLEVHQSLPVSSQMESNVATHASHDAVWLFQRRPPDVLDHLLPLSDLCRGQHRHMHLSGLEVPPQRALERRIKARRGWRRGIPASCDEPYPIAFAGPIAYTGHTANPPI